MTWAGATAEECERMTKCMVRMNRLYIPEVDGFRLEYLSMKLPKSPDTAPVMPIDDSDSSSDTSSGSSGDDSDFAEEEPGSPYSSDSSRTIGYTPPQFDHEANNPGSTQDMAIVIDDEEEDSPLCSPGQNMDVIDLTEDTEDIEPMSQLEILIQSEGSRKRKANDCATYQHPLIEFEAKGKLPFNLSFLILGLSNVLLNIR